MFKVSYKHRDKNNQNTTTIVEVFNVKNDKNGYPHFLIYFDNQWKWVSAKYCEPLYILIKKK